MKGSHRQCCIAVPISANKKYIHRYSPLQECLTLGTTRLGKISISRSQVQPGNARTEAPPLDARSALH